MNAYVILQMIWQIIPYVATLVLYTTPSILSACTMQMKQITLTSFIIVHNIIRIEIITE